MSHPRRLAVVLSVFACVSSATQILAAPVDDVKALLDRGQPAAAYAEARKHPQLLGDPAFDFYYGIAAIEGGRPGEGVLALERYLLAFPDNLSARLALARGYFLLGDDAHARSELAEIRKLSPPPDVLAAIDRYLEAIRLRGSRGPFSTGAYVEVGAGHDTNVNAGPDAVSILLPGFGALPLDTASQKLSDDFLSLGFGGYANYTLRPGLSLFASGQGERRWHPDEMPRRFELGNYNLAAGASLVRGDHLVRASLLYGHLTVGSERFRSTAAGSLEWQYGLGAGRWLTAGLIAARLDHGAGNEPRDANLYAASLGLRQQFTHAWKPVLSVNASGGEQRSRMGFDELVPRMLGLNASVSASPAPNWGVQLGYTFQRSRYQAPDFFAFPEHRNDRYHAVNAAVSWLLTRNWSLRLEALASRNRSNTDAYEFPRETLALKLRYEIQ